MSAAQKTIVMTGATKGVGHALAHRWLTAGHHVITLSRQAGQVPAGARDYPGVDMSDEASILKTAATLASSTPTIDWLVLVSGAMGVDRQYGQDDGLNQPKLWDEMRHVFNVNTVGPLMLASALEKPLKQSGQPIIAAISTFMASMGSASSGGYYSYRVSKAALNMAMVTVSRDWPDVCVACLHPGWVRTDMGGPAATLSPEESAEGLDRVIAGLSPADSGKFLQYDGKPLPW